jgi:DNA helicase IV
MWHSRPTSPHLRAEAGHDALRRLIERLAQVATGSLEEVAARNARFVDAEIKKHRAFFDSIEAKPLTQEQRVASIVLQDRNLLVAADGSGKTSTIVAKTGYSLLTKQYRPSEFLVLAFNNDAASELDQRISDKLASLLPEKAKVRCSTFHALGLAVIANGRGVKPSVVKYATGSETESSRFMEGLIDELLRTDKDFAVGWLTFRALYGVPAKPIGDFKSQREWEEYVRAIGDYKAGRRGFQTLKGEIVKSQGELAIANWLFAQGVPYEYERPYEHPTATERYRQYRSWKCPAWACLLPRPLAWTLRLPARARRLRAQRRFDRPARADGARGVALTA